MAGSETEENVLLISQHAAHVVVCFGGAKLANGALRGACTAGGDAVGKADDPGRMAKINGARPVLLPASDKGR
jgi:hypothetical protein